MPTSRSAPIDHLLAVEASLCHQFCIRDHELLAKFSVIVQKLVNIDELCNAIQEQDGEFVFAW